MKSVLIVPDVRGWVCDSMAKGIIRSLEHKFKFTLKYSDESEENKINWYTDYGKYDIIYLMLPSYLPTDLDDYSKIVTTFHGGPATENQADNIQRMGLQDMRISYVSSQTRHRTEQSYSSAERMKIVDGRIPSLKSIIDNIGLTEKDDFNVVPVYGQKEINIKYTKRGFKFDNLFFTPHGVDIDHFNQEKITNKFVCGYAGWARYLLGAQKNHRRGHWIAEAFLKQRFNLSVAGGVLMNDNRCDYNIHDVKVAFSSLSDKLKIESYDYESMPRFYSGLSCYLVPDKFAGGPVPVLEAGAMGVPVICTEAGLCGDIIHNGETGIIVYNQDEFNSAISFFRNNPEKRIKMGKNLQEYIRETRSWDAVSPYWEEFFGGE